MPAVERTIMDEWASVPLPPAPDLVPVTLNPATSALLVLDVQYRNCNTERRPRCVASVPRIQQLLARARAAGALVVYSLTRGATPDDVRAEVAPRESEPAVASSVDKFHGTELEAILREGGIRTAILVGTSAHGAVLHTAVGAAMRGFDVVVAVDGMSASDAYAEQYTAWHLANGPGTRGRAMLTTVDGIALELEV